MMMGGRSNSSKSIIDLLANSDALKAAIDSHNKATEARIKSAEDHRKAKEDASVILNQLKHKQNEHDERERQLVDRQQILDKLSGQLNDQIADYNFKHRNLEESKTELARQKSDQQHILQRMTNEVLAKDQAANQKHLHLEQQLMSVAQKHEELSRREALVLQRETEIVEFADKLRGR